MTPDMMNAVFELGGGFVTLASVRKLHHDMIVRGVHWLPVGFFSAWGLWNLYYYPTLDQWYSFAGGVWLVTVNLIWLAQMIYYIRREYGH